LLFGLRFSPRSRWTIAAVLLAFAGLLSVFITERYRLVAVPGLLVCAAYGVSMIWEAIASDRLQIVAGYLILLVAAVAFVSWPNRQSSMWALDPYNSGWQALEAGDLDLAEKKLGLAYAYVPTNSETNFALGNLRLAENRKADAESFFRATLQFDPHHKGALNNLGVIEFDSGDFDQARRQFEQALLEMPGDAKTHYLFARTLYAQGDLPAARQAIDRALSLNPKPHEFGELKAELERASRK
jgi:tetratricopeptide (TPR) repeat protein